MKPEIEKRVEAQLEAERNRYSSVDMLRALLCYRFERPQKNVLIFDSFTFGKVLENPEVRDMFDKQRNIYDTFDHPGDIKDCIFKGWFRGNEGVVLFFFERLISARIEVQVGLKLPDDFRLGIVDPSTAC